MKKLLRRFLIACLALLLLSGVCLLVYHDLSRTLQTQYAAEKWKGEGENDFAQLSCFLTETGKLSLEKIYTFRGTLQTKLVEASLSAPAGGSLWRDAWCGFGSASVSTDKGNATTAVTAVGGDFFFFHPIPLLSGSYLTEEDLMDDRVLLNRELAWKLYGGTDLTGLTVRIGDKPYVIAGVVDVEDDFATRKASSGGSMLYMSYDAFYSFSDEAIGCYEIVLPQPVDGFAENLLSANLKIGDGETVVNTGRFSLKNTFSILRSFGERSMHRSSVIYPYWENAARCIGDWCALFLALSVVLAFVPALAGFAALLYGLVFARNLLGEKIPEWVYTAREAMRKKRYSRKTGRSRRKT